MVSESLIEIEGLNFSYGQRPILKGIDMTMERGKVIAIMGGSGSGKTTLLRLIGGAVRPTSGYVKVAGEVVHKLKRDELFSHASKNEHAISVRRIVYRSLGIRQRGFPDAGTYGSAGVHDTGSCVNETPGSGFAWRA